MKATIYSTDGESRWKVRLSVCREVDRLYWTDLAFRRGAAEGWGAAGMETAQPSELLWLKELLPLGIAERAVDRLRSAAGKQGGAMKREDLAEAARWAASRAGEKGMGAGLRDAEQGFENGTLSEAGIDAGVENGVEVVVVSSAFSFERGRALAIRAREAERRLRGRCFLLPEAMAALGSEAEELLPALQLASLLGGVELVATVAPRAAASASLRCRRCGSGEEQLRRTPCASCGRQRCAYCEACIAMGRSRECGLLVIGRAAHAPDLSVGNAAVSAEALISRWGLSPAQSEAASQAMEFLTRTPQEAGDSLRHSSRLLFSLSRFIPFLTLRKERNAFLLWAVTGAGKTEMMFPLLEAVLSAGGSAAVATPRRDVVLELAPRLAKAFPHVRQVVLYGGSADRFENGALTLATTHQLIRFRHAFDLVVVDEVDAFPYHNDPALHYAAAQARSRGGVTVLLSATPPADMQRQARRGRLPHARVSVRFHRRPLPVPRRLAIPAASRWICRRRKLPSSLYEAIRTSLERGAQVFLFVPFIRQVEPLVGLLREYAAEFGIVPERVEGTSSQDPDRGPKVSAFRERTVRLLVTTTILERGVTIPKSDVFVLDADKPLFDAASLVQMAGRAGRSAEDPKGLVYFAASAWTSSQREACRQIREMNTYARRNGYLLG
ncbi:DNA/RNA helicase [Cohnella sp. CFH 77786]|uniref:DEAD/DEAH box helicase n=1 Tax=Cohnella sp. CFH 77786 TaxID=2662265 RepID=UPI001C60A83A|nr:helicase-related protein [Cohnella sp. CFH 77786]MBW5448483.1 DNA/RNA helicase [Cohnella sp. CFH 77786]